jgi:hypothetical protein
MKHKSGTYWMKVVDFRIKTTLDPLVNRFPMYLNAKDLCLGMDNVCDRKSQEAPETIRRHQVCKPIFGNKIEWVP